jgi:hypothetical protein
LIKACIECKYFKSAEPFHMGYQPNNINYNHPPECTHPNAATRDPIYGKALCGNERNFGKGCGKGGKNWEAKA